MEYAKVQKLLEERTSINSETGCWEYLGNIDNGYGRITIDYTPYQVHRLSALIFLNYNLDSVAYGLHVLHRCKSKNCWNPKHLYIGTNEMNIGDKMIAGNSRNQNSDKTHCKKGHEFTPYNTYVVKKLGGTERHCKLCQNARSRAYQKKKHLKIVKVG